MNRSQIWLLHTVAIWTFTFHKKSGCVKLIWKTNFKPGIKSVSNELVNFIENLNLRSNLNLSCWKDSPDHAFSYLLFYSLGKLLWHQQPVVGNSNAKKAQLSLDLASAFCYSLLGCPLHPCSKILCRKNLGYVSF